MFRHVRKGMIWVLTFLLLMLAFAPPVWATGKTAIVKYSGQEIFKGIVFGIGEVGEKLPLDKHVLKNFNNDTKAYTKIEEIIAEMEQLDPDYFSDLATAVYNKDPVKVNQVIEAGGPLLQVALQQLNMELLPQGDVDIAAAVAGWVAMVGAAVYNYAGAVHTVLAGVNGAVYLNLAVYQYVKLWGPKSITTQLEQETFIIDVIEALN